MSEYEIQLAQFDGRLDFIEAEKLRIGARLERAAPHDRGDARQTR